MSISITWFEMNHAKRYAQGPFRFVDAMGEGINPSPTIPDSHVGAGFTCPGGAGGEA